MTHERNGIAKERKGKGDGHDSYNSHARQTDSQTDTQKDRITEAASPASGHNYRSHQQQHVTLIVTSFQA